MTDTMKNLIIGLFVLAACGLIIFILLFIHPSVGDEAQKIRIRFADIDKVNPGTRVTYAGKPVGEVISIEQIQNPKAPREAINGVVYAYELTVGVDSHIKIYNTDKIYLRTSGLLGEKSIEITPEPAKTGEKIYIVNEKTIYAVETGSVEETLEEVKKVAAKMERALDSISNTLQEIEEQNIWEKVGTIAKNMKDITTALNKPKQWSELLANFNTFSKRILVSLDKVDETFENFTKTSLNLMDIVTSVKEGKGTIGRVLMRDDLYLRVNSLLSKANTIFDDINHYGLLFNLDKGWQRTRARRANLLTRLSTPMQFHNYFNKEINQINTSLSRISMVLQGTEAMQPECLMVNQEFKKVFADLLRRIDALELSVNLYNQQLDDVETRKTEISPDCYCN